MIQVSSQFCIPVKNKSEHWFFFSSDWHLDSKDFDRERFVEQHEEAKARNAHGIFYGDMWELIDVNDKRRYNKPDDQYASEDEMNQALERAWELFAPYVNIYDVVGLGNHEVSALKYKRIDIIRRLVERANKHRDRKKRPYPMIHGGYVGMVRYHFNDGQQHNWNIDIFWDHGQGGSAEISRGEIDLSRFAMWVNADIIALGHKHQHKFSQLPPVASINRAGNLVWRKRRGLITSPYKRGIAPVNFLKTEGYRRSYESETFRVPTAAEGGMFAKADLSLSENPKQVVTRIRIMEA